MFAHITDHGADHEGKRDLRCLGGGSDAPVLQDRDAIDQLYHLVETVGDVENGAALRLQTSEKIVQARDLADAEGRRRLVENDHRGVGGERLGDLHDLLLGDREPADDRVDVDARVDLGEHLGSGFA